MAAGDGRGLHPVPVHDGGRHRAPGRPRQMQPAVPHRGRGGADVGGAGGGQVAYVSTDHAPWPADRKASADIFACGAGLTGLQSFAPLMFTLLEERGLPPSLMATYCAERPRGITGWTARGRSRRARTPTWWCWSPASSPSTRRRSRTGRRCGGRRITAARCAPASPRPCSAAGWCGMATRSGHSRHRPLPRRGRCAHVTDRPAQRHQWTRSQRADIARGAAGPRSPTAARTLAAARA